MPAEPTDGELLEHARTIGLVDETATDLPARYRTRVRASFLNAQSEPGPDEAPGDALTVHVTVALAGDVLGQSTITIPLTIQEPHHG